MGESTAGGRHGGTLILLRHGESQGNADGLFTGVLDVPITERGREEAAHAARLLDAAGLRPAKWFSSPLQRVTATVEVLQEALGASAADVTVVEDWRLAERNYGALTNRTKAEVRAEFGEERFRFWRRSLHGRPPALDDVQWAELFPAGGIQPPLLVGRTESLADVVVRVAPVYLDEIVPALASGADVLVVAHGNSLRALCAILDDLDEREIEDLNLPTGYPLVYNSDERGVPVPRSGRYLDADAATAAARKVAAEGGT
ncbi:2,3-diphosphoglycerate-dependent phosphoglycerate mutase [Agromyces protaetiae]|uniref:2,3-bisphosphoglycerate-dependent phosphoglycerate mutase n=1 Tax=Agromyces protaetiae TaxID=2509455 RepID=A0A4P6FI35_9MICO|nr:2,3-diphosphoglycerate-dependent phosphoglycerate mutase [Agromyces protaetiae]QAY73617.1 2,3-diphosphoglycerate-dependent phosphoglycerate mutase [Agromyces protaetiae]